MLKHEQAVTLVQLAWQAATYSYSPYSQFMVGAALLTSSNKIFTGCNIENIAYSPSNCAERTAFFKAISEGEQDFMAMAVVGKKRDGTSNPQDFTAPCGVCRQVMQEFCNPEQFIIVLGNQENQVETYLLKNLLPHSFKKF